MSADPLLLAQVLATRSRVRRRDRWTREQLDTYQRAALTRLLEHARTKSPFYRDLHHGHEGAPLASLPIVTKAQFTENWDHVVTTTAVTRADVELHLSHVEQTGADPGHGWRGRWWMAQTGGSSGRRAALAWGRREWTDVLTSYARVNDWAGLNVDLRHPLRTAIVSSLNPTHQSAVVGASLRSRLVPALRLDARTPVPELAASLNDFAPRLLVCFASMIGPLADAASQGILRIAPQKVVAASEVLGPDARRAAERAWGDNIVVDTYAATETAGIASTCLKGAWHLYEDFVIIEPVDEHCRPVPVGETGDRVLVTVLSSRTLPLIRYELTDSVRLSTERCDCGLPFALLDRIEGRTEDTLQLPGLAGPVRVHPVVFHSAVEARAPAGWQVEQQPGRLLIRVAAPTGDLHEIERRVRDALDALGVAPIDVVVTVDALSRTPLGKLPLVRALPPEE